MKALKERLGGVFVSIVELIIGVLLIINPVGFTAGIIIGAGIVAIIFGLVSVIKYITTDAEKAALEQSLAIGLIALFAGVLCIMKKGWFIATFPVLTIVYGVATLAGGLFKIQWMFDSIRLKTGKWGLPLISAILSIACGVIIIWRPFATTAALWIFIGCIIIAGAIFDFVASLFGKRK